jgi:glycosyltransferase involved in cell wall biosynthesis
MSKTDTDDDPRAGTEDLPRVSVAIPIYNEEDSLETLLERLRKVLNQIPGGPHEILFVDDGSSDRSVELQEDAAENDPRIVVVELSRNFGHQTAITAALDYATGDVVVVMDGDLQDEPEVIPRFLDRYHDGYDVVYARRVRRKEGLALRFCYFLFYRLLGVLSSIRMPLDSGDFSLMSRRVVDQIRGMPEKNRYIRGLRTWVGFRQIGIDVERATRFSGRSKYSVPGLVGFAIDGVLSFSTIPLRASILLGFLGVVTSMIYMFYAIFAKLLLHQSPQGFTALIVVVVFLAALQFLVVGVLGEYVGRIYDESKRRPDYVVDKVVGSSKTLAPFARR